MPAIALAVNSGHCREFIAFDHHSELLKTMECFKCIVNCF